MSRMRYISTQTNSLVRFMGMSTAIANAKDVADWLGVPLCECARLELRVCVYCVAHRVLRM